VRLQQIKLWVLHIFSIIKTLGQEPPRRQTDRNSKTFTANTKEKPKKKFSKSHQSAFSIAYEHFSPKKNQAKELPVICNATLHTTSAQRASLKKSPDSFT